MADKHKSCGAEFKARAALAAILGMLPVAELMAKRSVHQPLINTSEQHAIERTSGISSGKEEAKAAEKVGEIVKLHAKIGQFVVKRDFAVRASVR